jgi:DNA-directed RNA polymerase III subunit RPC4
MPPKKPPPRRGGAAPAVKTEPQPEAPAQDHGQATAGAEGPISVASTPQATPSGTPIGTPAGTPAPTNPAVQRAGAAGRAGSSTPAARGRPTVAKPKFAGRRSQKSRAELEKEEAERRAEENDKKAKEDQRNRRRDAARGRGAFRGRQRGGYMGESERKAPDAPVMSGPFSLGQVSSDSSAARRSAPGWAARSGGGGGGGGGGNGSYGGGGGGLKQESGSRGVISDVMMADGANIKAEDGGYISSDDEEEEENKGMHKRNVDELTMVDLTLQESIAPVRVQRVEHKERTLGLNADGMATKDGSAAKAQARDGSATVPDDKKKGKQRAKDVEVLGEQHKYKGTYSESSSEQGDEPQIKEEPTDDARPTTPEPGNDAAAVPEVLLQSPVSSPETRRKNKDRIRVSGERPDFQTNEEQTEWELHQKDLRILHHELGRLAMKDQDGDAAMQGADAQPAQDDPRADKVYLFQFPPVLPDLTHKIIKPDPEAAEDAEAAPSANASNQLQSTDPEPSGNTHTFNPGRVGKMRIHKSGRATLDWGGTPMEIGMGSEASFLQDVIIANFKKNEEGKVESGTAMGMGQVKGKFIVTPDWNEILG